MHNVLLRDRPESVFDLEQVGGRNYTRLGEELTFIKDQKEM
jgi:hypothetical protein